MSEAPILPATERQDVVDLLHGVEVPDPWRWLEDIEDPRTRAWVDAQDDYARAILEAVPEREGLLARFAELFYVDAVSLPTRREDRFFYTRRHKDQEKAILYWREGEDGEERVLIDPNTLSDDGSVALRGWYPSRDGRLLAYKLSENNADESTMYLRDVTSGEDSAVDIIPGAKYAAASWLPDGSGFFYTYLPEGPGISVSDRPGYAEVRFHRVGTEPSEDALVFPRLANPRAFLHAGVSRDGRWLFLYVQHGWNATDVYFKDLHTGAPERPVDMAQLDALETAEWVELNARARGFRPLAVGLESVTHARAHEGRFYLITNHEAPRYRVFVVDPARPAREAWREIVAERDATLEGVHLVGGHFVLRYLRDAAAALEVRTLEGALVRELALPGIGSVHGVAGDEHHDDVYFQFSSFTRPPEIYRTSIATGDTELWARIDLPIDTSPYEVRQEWYRSYDGTPVPMFIVAREDLPRDGDNPTLLYGYGGFNVSLTPSYSSSVLVWLERGGVYAVPNLRGGGEFGERWHSAGKGALKQNVFDDFLAAAEHLVATGVTRPERLAIRGGSNGGLLVGAAMTQRPDLFRAVICAVPLLDMVRYHLFGSGKTWIPEYGSADDPELFPFILRYSPYHRVRRGIRYPAMLMAAADSDDRVDPLHARKFTAAVQWASAGDAPVMMRVERQAGHGGADLVRQAVESFADQWAFLIDQLDMR